jgi:hypothetical protein
MFVLFFLTPKKRKKNIFFCMETAISSESRLGAKFIMKSSARRLHRAYTALAAEAQALRSTLDTGWSQPLTRRFNEAIRLQGQKSPNTLAMMLQVFATVHRYMRHQRVQTITTMAAHDLRMGRLDAAAKRLSRNIRTALVTLRCVKLLSEPDDDGDDKNIEALGLALLPGDLDTSGPEKPPPIPGRNDLAFISRMAALLDKTQHKSVSNEEKQRAVAVCQRCKSEIEGTMRNLDTFSTGMLRQAKAIEKVATDAGRVIDEAVVADRHRHRVNVVYE